MKPISATICDLNLILKMCLNNFTICNLITYFLKQFVSVLKQIHVE